MNVSSPDLMQERGLFRCEPDLHNEIANFFFELEGSAWDRFRAGRVLGELAYLTAAEYALEPLLTDPKPTLPVPEPLAVEARHGRLAVVKANCMIFCVEFQAEPRFTLPDVTAFSGDVSKLNAVGLESGTSENIVGDLARAVDDLERIHRESSAELARRIGDSGVLRLQGFLWAVKLSLPHVSVADAVETSFEAFQLTQPTSALEELPA
jgi:hypothetical protein